MAGGLERPGNFFTLIHGTLVEIVNWNAYTRPLPMAWPPNSIAASE